MYTGSNESFSGEVSRLGKAQTSVHLFSGAGLPQYVHCMLRLGSDHLLLLPYGLRPVSVSGNLGCPGGLVITELKRGF